MAHFLRMRWRLVVATLLVALFAFVCMGSLRIQTPTISFHASDLSGPTVSDVAAEKFTDFTILHNLYRTDRLPPEDTWVSGLPLNYYYFGHLTHAAIGRLTRTDPGLAYNLALCTTAFLAAIGAMGLGLLVGRGRISSGLLAVFLVLAAGNLDSALQALTLWLGAPEGAFLAQLPRPGNWWAGYDFWRPSRAVINTITEFPAFSFLLGDLHAHLLALPVFLGGIQVVLSIGREVRRYRSLLAFQFVRWELAILAAFVLGILSATNSWDALTLTGLLASVVWLAPKRPTLGTALEAVLFSGLVLIVGAKILFFGYSALFYTPFPPLRFHFADGIIPTIVSSPIGLVQPFARTGMDEFLTHWGLLLLPISGLAYALLRRTQSPILVSQLCLFGLFCGLVWPLLGSMAATLITAGLLTVISGYTGPFSWGRSAHPEFAGLLFTAGFLLLLTEILYLDDIFGPPIDRINTVFKVWYGVWPLMVCAAILSIHRLGWLTRTLPAISRAALMLGLLLPMSVYPLTGLVGRLSFAPSLPVQTSLDESLNGLEYLARERPDDLAAAQWLTTNAVPGYAILETAGTQYTYAGRMATLSGRPVFAGWLNHALGWRGESFTAERDRRTSVTMSIYEGRDPVQTVELLLQNNIRHIVIGDLERRAYPRMNEALLRSLTREAFRSSSTHILEFTPDAVDLDSAFRAIRPEPGIELVNDPSPISETLETTRTELDNMSTKESDTTGPIVGE